MTATVITAEIPEGFVSRGFTFTFEHADFNDWHGESGGIATDTDTADIIPNDDGTWSLAHSIFGPSSLHLDSGVKYATLVDVKAAIDQFIADCPAAAKAAEKERDDWDKAIEDERARELAWYREQQPNIELVPFTEVQADPKAFAAFVTRHDDLVGDEEDAEWRKDLTADERDCQDYYDLRHHIEMNDEDGFAVKKIPSNSRLYRHYAKGRTLYRLRKVGTKLDIEIANTNDDDGIMGRNKDWLVEGDMIPVIREFTRPFPSREI